MTGERASIRSSEHKFRLTFHRTFSLVRPALTSILNLAIEYSEDGNNSSNLTLDQIRERTNLGTVYVEAMPRYAKAVGLLDDSLKPTQLGRHVHASDPLLDRVSTQWLMHYHISSWHGVGPGFWHHIVTERFRSGNEFTSDEISEQIARYVADEEKRIVHARDAKSTARVFLGTYTKSDALSNLRILDEIDDHRFRVLEPDAPPVWALAYAILDYWEANFASQLTINLNSLTGSDGFTSLFLTGAGRLNTVLREMQDEGYVEVHRVAPPYQVVLLRPDKQSVLERIYHHG